MAQADSPTASPGPTPRPPTEPRHGIARRRLLLGLGFGLANAAVLRRLRPPGAGDRTELVEATAAADATPTTAVTTTTPVTTPATLAGATATPIDAVFDRVITNGRVIDPESGFDQVANVGLLGGSIAAISTQPLVGTEPDIDATDRVVAPGFIDILSYEPNGYGEWNKIADGVTTNLGMHGLRFGAAEFQGRWTAEGAPVHFGGAVHTSFIRQNLGFGIDDTPPAEAVTSLRDAVEEELRAGYLGIHAQPEYTPALGADELVMYGTLAAELDVPLTVHARFSDNLAPGTNREAVDELIEVARTTGAWVHIEHINSTGGTGIMAEALGRIEAALAEGLRMSACMYPYTFWATTLQTARFTDWQERYALDYSDLQVAGTSERLNATTYEQAYAENMLTAAYAISETDNELAFAAPFVMVGSDAILQRHHNNHPRCSGCFSRVLGEYVRARGLVPLREALAKMTILPARLVGSAAPGMARKGRLQIGADADITIFDPMAIADRATIEDPSLASVGISWVLVDGDAVLTPAGLDRARLPGRSIVSAIP